MPTSRKRTTGFSTSAVEEDVMEIETETEVEEPAAEIEPEPIPEPTPEPPIVIEPVAAPAVAVKNRPVTEKRRPRNIPKFSKISK